MIVKHSRDFTNYFWGCPGFPRHCRANNIRELPLAVRQALLASNAPRTSYSEAAAFGVPPPTPGMAASSSGVPADIPVPPARASASKAMQVAFLHEALYTRQCDGDGRLRPSRRAAFDPRLVDVQRACRHPLTRLSWQGNQRAQYASCGLCGLKHVFSTWRRVLCT